MIIADSLACVVARCKAAPAEEEENAYELVGEPGKRNGEKVRDRLVTLPLPSYCPSYFFSCLLVASPRLFFVRDKV